MWGGRIKCPVVGVLKDFNDRSFRHYPAPLLITTNRTMYSQAAIKLESKNISSTLQSVKKVWEQTLPDFVYIMPNSCVSTDDDFTDPACDLPLADSWLAGIMNKLTP